MGHSYGGVLASFYTLKYPNDVKAVIYENLVWSMIDAIKTIHRNTVSFIRDGGDVALADKIELALVSCNNLKELTDLQMETPGKYIIKSYYSKPWSDEQKAIYTPFEVTEKQEKSTELHRQKIIMGSVNNEDFMPKLKDIKIPSLLITRRV